MRAYIIRRLLLLIPVVFIASIIIFSIVRFIPGTVVDVMVAQQQRFYGANIVVTDVDRATIERALGLDVSMPIQYGRWIGVLPQEDGIFSGIFQGNLGNSFWKPNTVLEEIIARWPVTLELGILGLIVAQLIALPVGIYTAVRQDTWGDYIGRSFAISCIAIPSFWLGTMVIVMPAIWWGYMPPILLIHFTDNPLGNLRMFIMPAVILGMALSGVTMRMTRTMMLEVLRQDYIRTAWAKGLKERVVILRHVLRNALIPVITVIGFQIPVIIGGTVIIEQIFVLPGMGRLLVQATILRDYPIVSGVMLIFGVGMVITNLVVDLTYSYLDPRVRYK